MSGEATPACTLHKQFKDFSKFGSRVDGRHMTLYNLEKWFKQAGIIDGRKVTAPTVAILFRNLFKSTRLITYEDVMKLIEELARLKHLDSGEIQDKLRKCGPPQTSSPFLTRKSVH